MADRHIPTFWITGYQDYSDLEREIVNNLEGHGISRRNLVYSATDSRLFEQIKSTGVNSWPEVEDDKLVEMGLLQKLSTSYAYATPEDIILGVRASHAFDPSETNSFLNCLGVAVKPGIIVYAGDRLTEVIQAYRAFVFKDRSEQGKIDSLVALIGLVDAKSIGE